MTGLPPDRLRRLAQLEGWHFWFVGRRALVESLLARHLDEDGSPILELGCGNGPMLDRLAGGGRAVLGLDIRPEGLQAARAGGTAAGLVQADATALPLRDASVAAVVSLDVMEHVDDGRLLAEVERVLRPGGLLLATVPAMPWLWSYRDQAAGHLRRYTRRDLRSRIALARLVLKEERYYQCLLFPLVVATRLLGRRNQRARDFEERPLPLFNQVLCWINRLEVSLSRFFSWPWGSSLVVVCGKK